MSTKEFDVEEARRALASVEETRARANTWPSSPMREDVHAHEYAKDHAASLLGPALDALSAARKERDEARGIAFDDIAAELDSTEMWKAATFVRRIKNPKHSTVTLSSLAERVKAIEERIGGKANG